MHELHFPSTWHAKRKKGRKTVIMFCKKKWKGWSLLINFSVSCFVREKQITAADVNRLDDFVGCSLPFIGNIKLWHKRQSSHRTPRAQNTFRTGHNWNTFSNRNAWHNSSGFQESHWKTVSIGATVFCFPWTLFSCVLNLHSLFHLSLDLDHLLLTPIPQSLPSSSPSASAINWCSTSPPLIQAAVLSTSPPQTSFLFLFSASLSYFFFEHQVSALFKGLGKKKTLQAP